MTLPAKALSGKQLRHLRAAAHHLKPVVIIGASRVTEGVIAKVDEDLGHHELIKIRLTDAERDEVTEAREVLCARTGATHVQTIGHTLVLYRKRPPEKEPRKRQTRDRRADAPPRARAARPARARR